MTSGHENAASPENQPAHHQGQPLATSEATYERLTAYGFAQRYTRGKIVADIGNEHRGYATHLLAQSTESVRALSELPEGRFDVVVAFGVIENLEHAKELVREAKRVLKEAGVLLVSVAEKRIETEERIGGGIDGRRAMYVPELRRLLKAHFGHVRLYRQGAVAGGLVIPVSEDLRGGVVPVESVGLSSIEPRFGAAPPRTRLVMAVCSEAAEVLGREEEERAYLVLDRDRRVFEECEERAEDVELMRGEIQRMQETEVQAFLEAIKVRQNLVRELLHSPYSYRNLIFQEIRYRRNIIHGNVRAIRQKGAMGSAKGAFRRLSALYRQLREGQKP